MQLDHGYRCTNQTRYCDPNLNLYIVTTNGKTTEQILCLGCALEAKDRGEQVEPGLPQSAAA